MLLKYLKQKRKLFLLAAICGLIFVICFSLYQFPIKTVLYPVALCGIVCAGSLISDYLNVRRKYLKLELMQSDEKMNMEYLPEADRLEEEVYQKLIHVMNENQQELYDSMEYKFKEMMDYYTVWAHQIKTPIAAMRLNLQNEDSVLSRKLMADLFRIEQYVEMVLMYLRLDSDSSDYVIKEHEIGSIVKAAVKKFSGEFISRKISLDMKEIDGTVITDDKWLSFVIEQVISNALKYTPKGTISIYMEEPKILCIKDTGIGIAPEDLPRIFEKGYTGYNGRADKKASGIGLYLCKRICTNLGHQISAVSEPDRGTLIRISLKQERLKVE